MKNKIEILSKNNLELQKLVDDLKVKNESLENELALKREFISMQELKLYELIEVAEKKIKELDESIKASHLARDNYRNGLIAIKQLDSSRSKKLKKLKIQ